VLCPTFRLVISHNVSISTCFVALCWVQYLYHNYVGRVIWHKSFWWFYQSCSSSLGHFSYFFRQVQPLLFDLDCFPCIRGVLGTYCSCTCHLFLTTWSPYSFGYNNTCWDWHFPILDNITRCLSHVTPSCLLSSPTRWELNGLVLSLVVSFFFGSPTQAGVCFTSSRHSFKYHVSTSPLMCGFRGRRLVLVRLTTLAFCLS
jgi:hypothetical protein